MKRTLRPLAVALALATCGGVAWSQIEAAPREPEPPSEIEQMLVDGLTRAVNMIGLAWGMVVPYELPEVLPNGDIIIRYKPPKNPPMEEPSDSFTLSPDETDLPLSFSSIRS